MLLPPVESNTPSDSKNQVLLSDVALMDSLMNSEDNKLTPLLNTVSAVAPNLLGPHAIKLSKTTGMYYNPKVYFLVPTYLYKLLNLTSILFI